jgi:hypothetical protein
MSRKKAQKAQMMIVVGAPGSKLYVLFVHFCG